MRGLKQTNRSICLPACPSFSVPRLAPLALLCFLWGGSSFLCSAAESVHRLARCPVGARLWGLQTKTICVCRWPALGSRPQFSPSSCRFLSFVWRLPGPCAPLYGLCVCDCSLLGVLVYSPTHTRSTSHLLESLLSLLASSPLVSDLTLVHPSDKESVLLRVALGAPQ